MYFGAFEHRPMPTGVTPAPHVVSPVLPPSMITTGPPPSFGGAPPAPEPPVPVVPPVVEPGPVVVPDVVVPDVVVPAVVVPLAPPAPVVPVVPLTVDDPELVP